MTGKGRAEELKKILQEEFQVERDNWGEQENERAFKAVEIYEDVESFLRKSGWGRDNPELQSEEYLTANRICRWVNGKFWYFSWIVWESGDENE